MKKQISIAITLGSLAVAAVLWFLSQNAQGPQLGGDFTLNHKGQPWRFLDNSKKVSLLYIGYAKCPDVCPMALSYTAQAFKGLNEKEQDKVQMIFISVDAAHDTAETVATYAEQFNPTFIGLTGSQEQIDAAIKPFGASYMVEENKKSYLGYSIAHTDRLYFLNSKGRVVDMIASPRSVEEIIQKIKENL